jgi:ATP-binding cassette subfamily B protein
MSAASMESRVQTASINANVETAIAGMRVSRAYTSAEHEGERFNHSNALFMKARKAYYRAMAWFFSATGLCSDLLYLIVLLFGGLFLLKGRINAGDFAAFLLYITLFLKPINKFVTMYEQLQNCMTGFTRYVEILDAPPEAEAADAIDAGRLEGHIAFQDVSFRYHSAQSDGVQQIIHNLDLDIPSGHTLALVGPSGGGKSTLCNLIPRFYDVDAGQITIDDIDIRRFTLGSLRKNIGVVSQDVFLFHGTIAENIAYGDFSADRAAIIEAAKRANIHADILALPQGYDSNVGERGCKLSGGQKQRISIARVFLKNPAILILDEATSALDNESEMHIQQSLEALTKGRTCLVVAHRLSTIRDADSIAVLTKAGIAERGTHESLMRLGGIYAALYHYQFRSEN